MNYSTLYGIPLIPCKAGKEEVLRIFLKEVK